jgi:hypothetical protein
MATSPQSNGVSPHLPDAKPVPAQRMTKQFRGCSRIADYEILGKLGEGTFGYIWPLSMIDYTNHGSTAKYIERSPAKLELLSR